MLPAVLDGQAAILRAPREPLARLRQTGPPRDALGAALVGGEAGQLAQAAHGAFGVDHPVEARRPSGARYREHDTTADR